MYITEISAKLNICRSLHIYANYAKIFNAFNAFEIIMNLTTTHEFYPIFHSKKR